MLVADMHYDIKKKLNKVDSNKYRNLLIPELDWTLNEAAELYVKIIAQPRRYSHLGFELNQRSIDDIRTLITTEEIAVVDNVAALPDDYWFYTSGEVDMTKGSCTNIKGKVYIRQHDDEFEKSPFDKSSFEWREVNATFDENGIVFYTDETFTISTFYLTYVKRIPYICNAEAFGVSGYELPSGEVLATNQDCILPEQTHREICDIAVLLLTGELQEQLYQVKQDKVVFNNLK